MKLVRELLNNLLLDIRDRQLSTPPAAATRFASLGLAPMAECGPARSRAGRR